MFFVGVIQPLINVAVNAALFFRELAYSQFSLGDGVKLVFPASERNIVLIDLSLLNFCF